MHPEVQLSKVEIVSDVLLRIVLPLCVQYGEQSIVLVELGLHREAEGLSDLIGFQGARLGLLQLEPLVHLLVQPTKLTQLIHDLACRMGHHEVRPECERILSTCILYVAALNALEHEKQISNDVTFRQIFQLSSRIRIHIGHNASSIDRQRGLS